MDEVFSFYSASGSKTPARTTYRLIWKIQVAHYFFPKLQGSETSAPLDHRTFFLITIIPYEIFYIQLHLQHTKTEPYQ